MMEQSFISLNDTYSHVIAVTRNEASAQQTLRRALIDGLLEAQAESLFYIYKDGAAENILMWVEPDFWKYAEIEWNQDPVTACDPEYEILKRADGQQTPRIMRRLAKSIRVEKAVVLRLWEVCGSSSNATGAEYPMRPSSRTKVGRPELEVWDRIFIAAACHVAAHGLPRTQAEFIVKLQEVVGDDAPGDTRMKERIGPLYRAVQKALAG